jgi:BTB/POZ domain
LIRIIVGAEREVFHVHKCFLDLQMVDRNKKSTFFKGCSEDDFKKAQQVEITLEDVAPEMFLLLVGWLYSDFTWTEGENHPFEEQPHHLYRACILAGRLGMERLQNIIMDDLLNFHKTHASFMDLRDEVLGRDDLPDQLDGYVLDLMVHQFIQYGKDENVYIVEDVIEAGGHRAIWLFRRIREEERNSFGHPILAPACKYHLHDHTMPDDCHNLHS